MHDILIFGHKYVWTTKISPKVNFSNLISIQLFMNLPSPLSLNKICYTLSA